MVKLYHYTNAEGAEGIVKSGWIRGSTGAAGDAFFGTGVYLTEMPPTTGVRKIARNNFDGMRSVPVGKLNKIAYYFAFDSEDLEGVKKVGSKRNVWLSKRDIRLPGISVEFGETDPTAFEVYYDANGRVTSYAAGYSS